MRRLRQHRDPTADGARLGELDLLFTGMDQQHVQVMLLYLLYSWTESRTAAALGLGWYDVVKVREAFFERFRYWDDDDDDDDDKPWSGYMKDRRAARRAAAAVLEKLRSEQDGKVFVSPGLRQLLYKCSLIGETNIVRCDHCEGPLPQRTGRLDGSMLGRPRRYCSNGCRQAAYRRRAKQGSVE